MSSKIGSSSNNRSADSSLSNSFNVSGSPHQSKDATSRKGGPVSGIWSDLLNNVSSGIAGDANTSNSPDPNVSADEGMLNSGDDSQDAEGIAAHMNKYKGKHILVIGDASSGKTTLLSMLRGGSGEKNSQKVKFFTLKTLRSHSALPAARCVGTCSVKSVQLGLQTRHGCVMIQDCRFICGKD